MSYQVLIASLAQNTAKACISRGPARRGRDSYCHVIVNLIFNHSNARILIPLNIVNGLTEVVFCECRSERSCSTKGENTSTSCTINGLRRVDN